MLKSTVRCIDERRCRILYKFRSFSLFCLLLAAAILLASCGGSPQTQEKRQVCKNLASYEIPLSSGRGALYEITAPCRPEEGKILCCAGMYDETHVLLLEGEKAADGAIAGYSVQLLDLTDFERKELYTFLGEEVPGSGSSSRISFLSADPLVLHDAENGILYRPGSSPEAVVLPAYLRDSQPYWIDGRLLLSSDRGILYEITENGRLSVTWTLPCEYGAFTPVVSGAEGKLTFSTYSRRDPSLQVYVDVDPAGGGSDYYLSDINPSRFSACSDGLLLGSTFRTKPAVSVCSPSDHVKKEMTLPDDIIALLSAEDAAPEPDSTAGAAPDSGDAKDSSLAFSTCPLSLCEDWCLWLLCDEEGRPVHLYLWDTASCRGEQWDGPSTSEYAAPETVDYGDLTKRAQALEDRYGIRVLIGANVPAEFADYSAQPFEEQATIDGSLSVLENVLSYYPDNYFEALKGTYYRDVAFYLTGALSPLNAQTNISNAGAFATESNGTMQLAFDLNDDLSPDTVIHELTHAADYRFAGEGSLEEEAWNGLNPEGFSYYYAYIDETGESYEYSGSLDHTAMGGSAPDDVWFIDPYSKTFPMEDRARLMENLLSGKSPYEECFAGRHVQEKLTFYFRFLRETLGDDSWPQQTAWEEALSKFAE